MHASDAWHDCATPRQRDRSAPASRRAPPVNGGGMAQSCAREYGERVSGRGTRSGRHERQAAKPVSPEALKRFARQLGCALDEAQTAQLCSYLSAVAQWNRRLNLTAAVEPRAQLEVLVLDALMLSDERLVCKHSRLLDVGAGAGAPTLALLTLRPDLSATLVDARAKRVTFLRQSAASLGLIGRTRIEQASIPPYPASLPHHSDLALSRATFRPREWLALGLELAQRTLVFSATEPEPAAPEGSVLVHRKRYRVPSSHGHRSIGLCRRCEP